MLTYNFDRVFKARGIDKPFAHLQKAGFSDSLASRLKKNKIARLNLSSIERLCLLLRCTPNDLMEWVPDKSSNVAADHPMHKIIKSEKIVDITKTLNSVPLERLGEIEELIKNKINNI